MKLRKSIRVAILGILVLVMVYIGYRQFNPPDLSIPAAGGASMTVTNFPHEPYYLQTDKAWAGDTVGGSRESLAAVGCAVCSVSMAFAQCGQPITPGALNARLSARGGYTRQGWLRWDVAAAVMDRGLKIAVVPRPTHALIDTALQRGQPVVVKVLLYGSAPHWVLIVGKDGVQYLVKNPLDGRKRIQKLSSLSGRIQSMRIVQRM